tara:strand:- start:841 stop:1284 length:444 start_codon:yes stop_codon:yes gene_type:complete
MKYLIIIYIALGLVLSVVVGIEYTDTGSEMLATYYGSPFVFAQKSLGSSMEYYYSISGLILNILIWSTFLYVINLLIEKYKLNEIFKYVYFSIVGLLMLFSTFCIIIEYSMFDNRFEKDFTYWYWNIDEKAEEWGTTYEGRFVSLKK